MIMRMREEYLTGRLACLIWALSTCSLSAQDASSHARSWSLEAYAWFDGGFSQALFFTLNHRVAVGFKAYVDLGIPDADKQLVTREFLCESYNDVSCASEHDGTGWYLGAGPIGTLVIATTPGFTTYLFGSFTVGHSRASWASEGIFARGLETESRSWLVSGGIGLGIELPITERISLRVSGGPVLSHESTSLDVTAANLLLQTPVRDLDDVSGRLEVDGTYFLQYANEVTVRFYL